MISKQSRAVSTPLPFKCHDHVSGNLDCDSWLADTLSLTRNILSGNSSCHARPGGMTSSSTHAPDGQDEAAGLEVLDEVARGTADRRSGCFQRSNARRRRARLVVARHHRLVVAATNCRCRAPLATRRSAAAAGVLAANRVDHDVVAGRPRLCARTSPRRPRRAPSIGSGLAVDDGDADAGGDLHEAPADFDRLLERLDDTFGQAGAAGGSDHIVTEDDELVAAVAHDPVARANCVAAFVRRLRSAAGRRDRGREGRSPTLKWSRSTNSTAICEESLAAAGDAPLVPCRQRAPVRESRQGVEHRRAGPACPERSRIAVAAVREHRRRDRHGEQQRDEPFRFVHRTVRRPRGGRRPGFRCRPTTMTMTDQHDQSEVARRARVVAHPRDAARPLAWLEMAGRCSVRLTGSSVGGPARLSTGL